LFPCFLISFNKCNKKLYNLIALLKYLFTFGIMKLTTAKIIKELKLMGWGEWELQVSTHKLLIRDVIKIIHKANNINK